MSNQNVYLKPSILLEPLFNQWYAWPYLIPPASAAMYIANAHVKIMQSFVAAPQVHISALKNPGMLGGPFINYDTSKVSEIKELAEKTTRENANMVQLADAIKTLLLERTWKETLQRWRVDRLIVEKRWPLAQALAIDPDFRIVYADDVAVIAEPAR